MANWGFHQLKSFVVYKAALAGVPVVLVDPRDTSRQCSCCGVVDKASRRTRDDFLCTACGHAAPADHNAALNIRARANTVHFTILTAAAKSIRTVGCGARGRSG
jgi:transposase